MRILERQKIPHKVNTYQCDEFHDGVQIAEMLGQDPSISYKTLVCVGKSGGHFVFVIPIASELDLKAAARAVGEKSVEMIHVKDILSVTGYIRGGCSPIGMKKAFPTVVDITAQSLDEMIISGGRIGSQIFLSPSDLIKASNGIYSDIITHK